MSIEEPTVGWGDQSVVVRHRSFVFFVVEPSELSANVYRVYSVINLSTEKIVHVKINCEIIYLNNKIYVINIFKPRRISTSNRTH